MPITGKRLGYIPPGSPEWNQFMTASKIAAVMGVSRWESRFSLWHRMAGNLPKPSTDEMVRGNILEPAIVDWYKRQHPELRIQRAAMHRHRTIEWAAATPDRIIRQAGHEPELLEVKTANNRWEWGRPGSSDVPTDYEHQAVWQAGVMGVHRVRFAVLFSGLAFEEYVVDANPALFEKQVAESGPFMESIAANEPPSLDPLDGHMQTYQAVRHLHPEIDDGTTYDLPPDLAARAQQAVLDDLAGDDELTAVKAQILDQMGDAQYAETNGHRVARRQAKGEGTPFLVLHPSLKTTNLTKEKN